MTLRFTACSILCLFLCLAGWAGPSEGPQFHNSQGPVDWKLQCRGARVIYLGEDHDSALDHQLQLQILRGLAQPLTVLAEMFQLPSAPILQDYVEGRLDDTQLQEMSEWTKRWGHSWEQYLPIWQFCRESHIPLRPLRNSSESGKLLSKLGVEAFNEQERIGLSAPPYEFGEHPEALRAIFQAHGGIDDEAFASFLNVQTLWEEFMAGQIRKALQERGGTIVVLVGKGHLVYGHGLPWRVQAGSPETLSQRVFLVNPKPEERLRADFWWDS